MKTKLLLSAFMQLFIFTVLVGQAPNKFNYQAVLRDVSGNIRANSNVTITLSLLQNSVAGTAVYTETHTTATNSYGLVNLQIGSGTVTLGDFNTLNWSTGTYFISISVDGIQFGISQLISVPYAKYADNAGNGFSGNFSDLAGKPTTIAGYGITNAVTTTGNQTIAGNKTFSGTVVADSLALTNRVTKWVFHGNNLRVQETASAGKIVVNPIGESYSQVVASATGASYVFMPLDVPFQILGVEQKVKSITFNYKCASNNVYITNVYVRKHKQGDMLGVITSSTDYTSTTDAAVTLTASTPVAFADYELDILFSLQFNGTGVSNAINFYEIIFTLQ
jgi:hypothetical protein